MSNPQEIAKITAQGKTYERWTNVRVRLQWTMANEFALSVTEENAGGPGGLARATSWSEAKLKTGDPVTVNLAGQRVIDGRIEARTVGYNARMIGIMVQGRSRSGEVVDASAPVSTGQYQRYTFRQIATGLLSRLGVRARFENLPPGFDRPFENVSVGHGETAHQFIERLARMRGVFYRTDTDGAVVFGTVGNAAPVADLEEGRNILELRAQINDANVYGSIIGHGQRPGSDEEHGARRTQVSARSDNPHMTNRPNRQLVLVASEPVDQRDLQARVDRANADRIGTQVQVTVTVQGWHRDSGALWKTGEQVKVKSPIAFPNASGEQTLAIRAIEFLQDAYAGTTTQLELCLPHALGAQLGATPGGAPNVFQPSAQPASVEA